MATPDFFGTANADTVVRNKAIHGTEWATYYAGAGNDTITWSSGNVLGEAGNDTIIRANGDTSLVYSSYWNSPAGISADLASGVATDGFGGTDKLVNLNGIGGSPYNDTIFGAASDDWVNGGGGIDTIDGRGGIDHSGFNGKSTDYTIVVTVDGRGATVTSKSGTEVATLRNVEYINFFNDNVEFKVADLIDKSQVGLQVLVESTSVRWNLSDALGSAVALTYSFTDSKPAYGYGTGGSGGQAWTSAQKDIVRAALAKIASETLLTFTEVSDGASSYGQMRFGVNTQATTGYSFSPAASNGELAGDVWLSATTAANLATTGQQVLYREIAHALGLTTPLGESYTGTKPVLLNVENDTRYTVMSTTDTTSALSRDNLGVYDLAGLRSLYGSKAVATANNSYAFNDASGRKQNLIVDDGGTDTFDASTASISATIDLREGRMSSVGRDSQDLAVSENIAIAFGSVIENAIGTSFDDVITGNAADNLLKGMDGNDIIDGGAGSDTAQYSGKAVDYDAGISSFSGELIVAARNGTSGSDILRNVEKLQFSDGTYAIVAMTANATSIAGGSGADIVLGNDLDNTLQGAGGNDYLKGGLGTDTAQFTGNRAAYNVTVNTDGTLKVAARSGSDGTDILDGMERIKFADMTVNLSVGALAKTIPAASLQAVEELYTGFFNRTPDADGMAYWIAQVADGATIADVGNAFYGVAVQYSALTGYSASMTNNDFIKIVYKNVLGRDTVDQGGLDYWNGQLSSGSATRGSMVANLITAAHSYKGDKTYGYVADLLDNKLAVATYFSINQGLSYNTADDSIRNGTAIAAAVTPTDTAAALKLIGVSDPSIVLS